MDLANNTSYAKNVYVVSEYRELKYAVDNLKKMFNYNRQCRVVI